MLMLYYVGHDVGYLDLLAIDDDIFFVVLHSSLVHAVNGVVLEH